MRTLEQPHFAGYSRIPDPRKTEGLERGGRTIAGVNPHPVLLETLKPEDYQIVFKNQKIQADGNAQAEDFLYMIDNSDGTKNVVLGRPPHWRSVDTPGHTSYPDESGIEHHYFDISTKGIGMVKGEVMKDNSPSSLKTRNEYGSTINLGHATREDFEWMYDLVELTKRLTAIGIRSELYWVIAQVNKVSFNGELLNLDQARERGIVDASEQNRPYMGVRLLRSNRRIEEYVESENGKDKKDMLLAVYGAFNEEAKLEKRDTPQLQIDNPEHQRMYFDTMFKQHIKNLALLISHGLTYYHMHSSNLTLMGEIVDTAAVKSININKLPGFENDDISARTNMYRDVRVGYMKDMRDCVLSLRKYWRALGKDGYTTPTREEMMTMALETFQSNYNPQKFATYDPTVDAEKICAVFEEIVRRQFVGRETLSPLKSNSIESWDLRSI